MKNTKHRTWRSTAARGAVALGTIAGGLAIGTAGTASAEVNDSAECNQMWADGYADQNMTDAEYDAIVAAGCDDMGGSEPTTPEPATPAPSTPEPATPATPAPQPVSTRDAWVAANADGVVTQEEWADLVVNGHTYTYARSDQQASLSAAAWQWANLDGEISDSEWNDLRDAGFADVRGVADKPVSDPTRDAWVAANADGVVTQEEWADLVVNGHTYTYARSDRDAALSAAAWQWANLDGEISDSEWTDLRSAGFADIRGGI